MSAWQHFLAGVRAVAPIAIGVIPFGAITGIAALEAGVSAEGALAMASVIFAGASQVVAAQLIGVGAPALIVIVTALVVNLRFLMYSASLSLHFTKSGLPLKSLAAYLITDQSYAVSITHFNAHPALSEPQKMAYYLGSALPFWAVWQAASIAGVIVGREVPAELQLDFTIALSFIALLIPGLKDRPLVVAAAVGGGVAVALAFLPYRLGLLVGALAGISAGLWLELRQGAARP